MRESLELPGIVCVVVVGGQCATICLSIRGWSRGLAVGWVLGRDVGSLAPWWVGAWALHEGVPRGLWGRGPSLGFCPSE